MTTLHIMARLVNFGAPLCGAQGGITTKDPTEARACNECAAILFPRAIDALASALFGWLDAGAEGGQ